MVPSKKLFASLQFSWGWGEACITSDSLGIPPSTAAQPRQLWEKDHVRACLQRKF